MYGTLTTLLVYGIMNFNIRKRLLSMENLTFDRATMVTFEHEMIDWDSSLLAIYTNIDHEYEYQASHKQETIQLS